MLSCEGAACCECHSDSSHVLYEQVKIKKDAHDRKLLGEYNIELQAALSAFEDKFARQQRDVDAQTTRIIALESLLHEKAAESVELAQLRRRNKELTEVRSCASAV